MHPDDVDVEFLPATALAKPERDEWCRIVAAALADDPGTASAVFATSSRGWVLQALHWYKPGSGFLQSAGWDATAPLRKRVIAALRAAGKDVVESRRR